MWVLLKVPSINILESMILAPASKARPRPSTTWLTCTPKWCCHWWRLHIRKYWSCHVVPPEGTHYQHSWVQDFGSIFKEGCCQCNQAPASKAMLRPSTTWLTCTPKWCFQWWWLAITAKHVSNDWQDREGQFHWLLVAHFHGKSRYMWQQPPSNKGVSMI